jgi:hypothetical protein
MKTRALAVSLTLIASLAAAGAAAAEGKIYLGVVAGGVDASFPGFDNAANAGVYGGYNLLGKDAHFAADLRGGTLAAEGQVTMSGVKGDTSGSGKWDMTSVAAYAAYRHPLTDSFYLKGKLGLARYDINTALPSVYAGAQTAFSAGIGAGVKVGPGRAELEVTSHEGDVLFVSAGFHMAF